MKKKLVKKQTGGPTTTKAQRDAVISTITNKAKTDSLNKDYAKLSINPSTGAVKKKKGGAVRSKKK